jgi:ABC-type uncharacterized transport system permease subunit
MFTMTAVSYLILGYITGKEQWQKWVAGYFWFTICLSLTWVIHAIGLYRSILRPNGINLDVATAGSLLTNLAVAVYMIGQQGFWGDSKKEMYRFWHHTLPCFAVTTILPGLWPGAHLVAEGSPLTTIHWWIGLLSLTILGVATLQATWLAHWGTRLKQNPAEFNEAPSLLALENALFIWVWISFILLSITIGSGIIFSEQLFGHPFQSSSHRISHKVLLTWITWFLLGVILWKRHYQGIRGYTAARWLQWSSGFAILGYLGSKFVLEILLKR